MLLVQWSTHDWGAGLHFSFDVTRQFIPGLTADPPLEADFPTMQLYWTFAFEPREQLRALGSGNKWCRTPQVFGVVAASCADTVELTYESVE